MPFTYDVTYKSPNFGYPKGREGRGGHEIIATGLHITGAAWESNYHWIMNPAANASYNAVVRDDGSVISVVPEENAAYSHGRVNRPTWPLLKKGVNPNLYTLSVARTGSNQNTWTKAQLDATVALLRHWGENYGIILRLPFIFGHFEIDSVGRWYCPGAGFFNRVMNELAKPVPKEGDLREVMLENIGAGEGEGGGEDSADDEAAYAECGGRAPEPAPAEPAGPVEAVTAGPVEAAPVSPVEVAPVSPVEVATAGSVEASTAGPIEVSPAGPAEVSPGVRAYYRVVVGSYAEEAAAKRHVGRLREDGVEAFVALYLDDTEKMCRQARDEQKSGRR